MKKGVLLVTLGGPKTLGEVNDFLIKFIGKELPPPVMRSAIERYRLIGGGSPLNAITEQQALALNELLGEDYLCLPAFRYTHPSIEEAIDMTINSEVEKLFFFILSPYYTSVTTGNYIDQVKSYLAKLDIKLPVTYIHSWYKNPLFINSWVDKIKNEAWDKDAFYLFSAHSLPTKLITEPYKIQIEETAELIAKEASLNNYILGWQSVPGNAKEPWFSPSVEERIDEIKERGFKKIIQVPIGFTADHIETLYDIDITHKSYAIQNGLDFYRISSLNTSPLFITALKDILLNSEV